MLFESYHGSDPLKQMRTLQPLDLLSDVQCLELYGEMQSREWKLSGALSALEDAGRAAELAYQKTKWLIERSNEMRVA